MAQQVASYVVRPSILRAASLAGYRVPPTSILFKTGTSCGSDKPRSMFPASIRFDGLIKGAVYPGKKMGEREPDLYISFSVEFLDKKGKEKF